MGCYVMELTFALDKELKFYKRVLFKCLSSVFIHILIYHKENKADDT